MVKLNKPLALIIISLMILSNIAFAESNSPSEYENRPIDESREGIDYHKEGNIIIYPARISSKEKEKMERFTRGDLSEEEMRAMAKEKFGERFNEMEFEKSMLQAKDRMSRKDAFSYEHEGFHGYYVGPSYEGYSKEHMIFGVIFGLIGDDIDPREIKQYCNNSNKIADIVISKLKENVGELQNVCGKIKEQETKCEEHSKKGCFQIGTSYAREDANEMEKLNAVAYSCPPNENAIVEACKRKNRHYMEQRLENIEQECKKRFDYEGERLSKECEKFREYTICEKEDYIKRCMGGIEEKDFERKECSQQAPAGCPIYECVEGSISVQNSVTCCYECKLTNTRTSHCKETDGSYDIYNKGVTYPDGTEHGKSDACLSDKTLVEYGCNADGFYGGDRQYTCEFGCKDGACLRSSQSMECPEEIILKCESGQTVQKKTDDRGCAYYYCESSCQEISKPSCNADEKLETYYDNAGCISSYQCIKIQISCPSVEKPACTEGQQLITKYDDRSCVTNYECVNVSSTTGGVIGITGAVVLNTYEDYLRHCENSWIEQQRICSNTQICDKGPFIERCKEQERKNYNDFVSQNDARCRSEAESQIRHIQERCSRIGQERQRCIEESAKRCSQMAGLAEQCAELMTEERLRQFIVEEAEKRCKFTDIIEDEDDLRESKEVEIVLAVLNTATEDDIEKLKLFVDGLEEDLKLEETTIYKGTINPSSFGDVKLLPFVVNAKISTHVSSERAKEVKAKIVARQKVEEIATELVSLRDSDVPDEYLYLIEDQASDVLNVSDELEEIEKKDEEKGFGYKLKLFLGLARAAEKEEIKQLDESKAKLSASIEVLAKLAEEVPSDVAKAILKEQVENLQAQHDEIEVLIETKEKKSNGLWGIFS